jgi:hypothetical protein
MANVLTRIETVSNAGATLATFGANNYKHAISTSDAGRTLILKLAGTNLTDANLLAVIGYITTSQGVAGAGDSAFTVAGVGTADGTAFESGVTDTVYLKVQGTGDITVATADMSVGGLTITVEAIFTPAK